MTTSGSSGPACRDVRQLLGVYVVGAIDPAERSVVDEHLGQCQACRDELAGLAGLPAMLGRVPAADVERLSGVVTGIPGPADPPDELLNVLLRTVAVKRRERLWRGAVAVAASAVIAAGGAVAAVQLSSSGTAGTEVASGSSPGGRMTAVVDYSPTSWGTAMRVQVSGIASGTTCKFFVVGKNGTTTYAGTWTVGPSSSARYQPGSSSARYQRGSGAPWYSAAASVPVSSVRSFRVTSGGATLVTIPAS